MSSPPVVLVIGCGIAGPVIAILLKRKGYHPIVFDKVSKLGNAGAALMLMPNGLKVLHLIGLAEPVMAETWPLAVLRDLTAQGRTLGKSDVPSTCKDKFTQHLGGIKRTSLNMMLNDKLRHLDIEVRQGWKFLRFEEDDTFITAIFDNGRSVNGSFLLGCDGIKSATRTSVLAAHGVADGLPTYTGLMQTVAVSVAPMPLLEKSELRNWYGDGLHVIAYPISPTLISWAVTQRGGEEEVKESWRSYRTAEEVAQQKKLLSELLSDWDDTVLQLVDGAETFIKVGLFDRDELPPEHWYSKRCILVGDASHPSTPHRGQGANQALEDCYHLYTSMPTFPPEAQAHDQSAATTLGPELSTKIFKPFADKRQPRTSALVKIARSQGDRRVVSGEEACRRRDADIIMGYEDMTEAIERFANILREPFNEV